MRDWKNSLARVQQGDLTAFDAVVMQFQGMAVGYAYSILHDFQLAEDAAQEAFIQAYVDREMLREPQAFPAYGCESWSSSNATASHARKKLLLCRLMTLLIFMMQAPRLLRPLNNEKHKK